LNFDSKNIDAYLARLSLPGFLDTIRFGVVTALILEEENKKALPLFSCEMAFTVRDAGGV